MTSAVSLAEIAALVGDPARANMLNALMGGRALTATELAYVGGISPQTASGHLAKMTDGRLLGVLKQGRFRYYRLAGPEVARMLESIMAVAADGAPRFRPVSKQDEALKAARTCYDHLAGRLGVSLADALVSQGHVRLGEDAGEVTESGVDLLRRFGVDLGEVRRQRRAFCRCCLDWTERRPHLAGALGAALAGRCFALHWVKPKRDSRALDILPAGRRGLSEVFGITLSSSAGEGGRA